MFQIFQRCFFGKEDDVRNQVTHGPMDVASCEVTQQELQALVLQTQQLRTQLEKHEIVEKA